MIEHNRSLDKNDLEETFSDRNMQLYVLANEVVRLFFNLTSKGCWESLKRILRVQHALSGITDFNSPKSF